MARRSTIVVIQNHYRDLAESYRNYQSRLGYTRSTCDGRTLQVREFLHWLEVQGKNDITKVQSPDIQNYYGYISERPNKQKPGVLSLKATFDHMQAIRHLFNMLHAAGEIKTHPCNTLKFPHPKKETEREVLTQAEIKQLYGVCTSAWERTILSLGYGCGLRSGEMEQVNINDVRLREKIIIVPKGKGNKRRIIPMSSGVVEDLSDYYFNEREKLAEGRDYQEKDHAFMLNNRGGRMREFTYNKYLKRLLVRTENESILDKEISIHNLRHSIATHLIEQGLSTEQVRQFLGHSELETTQVYTHISAQQLKDLIDATG